MSLLSNFPGRNLGTITIWAILMVLLYNKKENIFIRIIIIFDLKNYITFNNCYIIRYLWFAIEFAIEFAVKSIVREVNSA